MTLSLFFVPSEPMTFGRIERGARMELPSGRVVRVTDVGEPDERGAMRVTVVDDIADDSRFRLYRGGS